MVRSYRHNINKHRLMIYFFRFCQIYSDKGHFALTMDMRIELMGNMAVGILEDIGQIDMTW